MRSWKPFAIHADIYDVRVVLSMRRDIGRLKRLLPKKRRREIREYFRDAKSLGTTFSTENRHLFMVVVDNHAGMDVIVHELAHVAIDVCNFRGIPIAPNQDEAFCYLLDHLVAQFNKGRKQQRRKR